MPSNAELFKNMHADTSPLLLVNVWDPASALVAQSLGAVALGTSSAALAWSLGYRDGEQLPVDELLAAVTRLLRVSRVPLSIDLEQGYSDNPQQVAQLVVQLAELGVAGMNLEDGLAEPTLLCQKMSACREQLAGQAFFINARTDVMLRGLAATESLAIEMCRQRLQLYKSAGADGAFVPGLTSIRLCQELTQSVALPLNIMGWPAHATMADMNAAGVKRISAGPTMFLASSHALQLAVTEFLQQPAPKDLFDYATMQQLF
ncbi:MAG: isocitrate lyase/phosphoenolpyruvate mutase family protein [Gammaproteobacteria bacterium]|nr:isocitrate lyase/phosphoenolpyruvate mutase family protein [Gammaproteobacteria bacterium]